MIVSESDQELNREAVEEQTQSNGVIDAVAMELRSGLLAHPRTLSPWLFYDEEGSRLFEAITTLPEYYLTRSERGIFAAHAAEIIAAASDGHPLTVVELGAGTAAKTGLLLRACLREQGSVVYQPIDVSPTALAEARETLERDLLGVSVEPRVANYITEPLALRRPTGTRILALYIGSSIGNFSPPEATGILISLRRELSAGDSLLLGTDLAPGETKSVNELLAAYDDAAGITAAFNRNMLTRLNRDLGSDFDVSCFAHRALWNADESRIEMHLVSLAQQTIHVPGNSAGPALALAFNKDETIHTENSYKFTRQSIAALMGNANFTPTRRWLDPAGRFAVTLATAV